MMTRRLDEDDESILPPRAPRPTGEREMTLGTGAILAIFFGLVVLCGAFFGFGYKLGSSASKTLASTATDATQPIGTAASASLNSFKPPAGSPTTDGSGTAGGIAVRADGAPVLTPPTAGPASSRTAPVAAPPITGADTEVPATTPSPLSLPRGPQTAPAPPSPTAPLPAASASGTFVVQVAAVSHQEDADLLVNALRSKGYAVAARSEAGDKLVHIQVGPFRDKNDANAMRQRLMADGYNAYIK